MRAIWVEAPLAAYVACSEDGAIVGTYMLKANQPGLGSHVSNCGYAVATQARGQGVAAAMCEHSQAEARAFGFRSMQFNIVVSTNEAAVHLWRKLWTSAYAPSDDLIRAPHLVFQPIASLKGKGSRPPRSFPRLPHRRHASRRLPARTTRLCRRLRDVQGIDAAGRLRPAPQVSLTKIHSLLHCAAPSRINSPTSPVFSPAAFASSVSRCNSSLNSGATRTVTSLNVRSRPSLSMRTDTL